MAILGVRASKDSVCIAWTTGGRDSFDVRTDIIKFNAGEWRSFYDAFKVVVEEKRKGADPVSVIAIAKCSTGKYTASAEAFKAEGLVELIAEQLGVRIVAKSTNSFTRMLKCSDGEKWQARAKQEFNSNGAITYFGAGIDAAVCAAYAACEG